jgi:ABC-2 type transport system permease protein
VKALVLRSFGRVSSPFLSLLAILSGFQVALVAMASAFAESGNFERLVALVPAVLAPAISPALTSFDRMLTIGYFDVLIVMLVVQWAIYVGTEPAGEIESGLVDLVLARPVPRHRLVTRTLVVMMTTTLLLALGMLVGMLLGLMTLAPPDAPWPEGRLVRLMITHLTLVAWCFGAAALAVSGWARRRASAVAVVSIGAVALYLVDFLGLWWTPAEAVARFSPFFYFHGGTLIAGTADPVRNVLVLGSLTVSASLVAYARFARRDL